MVLNCIVPRLALWIIDKPESDVYNCPEFRELIYVNYVCYIYYTMINKPWSQMCRFNIWININTLRSKQNCIHVPDEIFKYIFLDKNVWIPIKISLKFNVPINNISALLHIIAWRWPGAQPLSETMSVKLPTHMCVTRPQWVKCNVLFAKWRQSYVSILTQIIALSQYWIIIKSVLWHSLEINFTKSALNLNP